MAKNYHVHLMAAGLYTLLALGTVEQLKQQMNAPNLEEVFVRLVEQTGAVAPQAPQTYSRPASQYDWG